MWAALVSGAAVDGRGYFRAHRVHSRGGTALHAAVTHSDPSALKAAVLTLLGAGADVDAADASYGLRPLHVAAGNPNAEAAAAAVAVLVAASADVNASADCAGNAHKYSYYEGWQPLHDAAGNLNAEAAAASVAALVAAGAAVNASSAVGWRPLHVAARNSNAEAAAAAVRALVAAGADVTARAHTGQRPLHAAATNGDAEAAAAAITALVAAGADVNATANYARLPLHDAADGNDNPRGAAAAALAFLAAGANKTAVDGGGRTPHQVAMKRWLPDLGNLQAGDASAVQQLLQLLETEVDPPMAQLLEADAGPAAQPSPPTEPDCVVCLEAPRSHALLPCGHRVLCGVCAARRWRHCPVCREVVDRVTVIYT